MDSEGQRRKLNKSGLITIAMLTMVLDHTAYIFLTEPDYEFIYIAMRLAGRIAFPIYAFFISEGYFHTRNFKAYFFRILIAGLISEGIFDLALFGDIFYPAYQNVLFTFAWSLLMIYFIDRTESEFLQLIYLIFFLSLSIFMRADYGLVGILSVFGFYFASLYESREFFFGIFDFYGSFFLRLKALFYIFYSGNRGRDIKILTYLFYPGHLLILYLIKTYIFK